MTGFKIVVVILLSPTDSSPKILVCKITNIWMPACVWEECIINIGYIYPDYVVI